MMVPTAVIGGASEAILQLSLVEMKKERTICTYVQENIAFLPHLPHLQRLMNLRGISQTTLRGPCFVRQEAFSSRDHRPFNRSSNAVRPFEPLLHDRESRRQPGTDEGASHRHTRQHPPEFIVWFT